MISVIIVNYNSAALVRRAVESLSCEREELEIIVVDNSVSEGQRNELGALAGGCSVVYNEENEGFAGACNRAYEKSSGEWVFLLNPDAYILPGALSALREFLVSNPHAAAAGPKIYWDTDKAFLLPPSLFPSAAAALMGSLCEASEMFRRINSIRYRSGLLKVWTATSPVRQQALSGGHVLLRRSALEACGGLFDARFFMYYEDSDLMFRLAKRGYEVFVVPGAEVVHNYIHDSAKLQLMSKSAGMYYAKNFGNSILLRIAGALPKTAGLQTDNFTDLGVVNSPMRFEIPEPLAEDWLFECSPVPSFIPSTGHFGRGSHFDFSPEIYSLLAPGRYYCRAGSRSPFASLLVWMWEKV